MTFCASAWEETKALNSAGHTRPENPYMPWIETYSDEAFGRAVARMMDLANAAATVAGAETRVAMLQAFVQSTRGEWQFWDAAYRLERRPAV